MQIDILLFGLARCRHRTATSIPASFNTSEDAGEKQFNEREGNVEYHGENDDGADSVVPVWREVVKLAQKDKADLLQGVWVLVVYVE